MPRKHGMPRERMRERERERERERVDAYGSVSPRELRHINNLFLIDISDRRQSHEWLVAEWS